MELSLVFDLISTLAVVIGIIFGLIQLRQYRLSRKREAALFLLNSYQTREFVGGLWTVQNLRDGMTKAQLEEELGGDLDSIGLVMTTWETIGILLFHREITIEIIDDAFSGPILFSWRKLEKYVQELRKDINRQTLFEWFQWLSDRMRERETHRSPMPAYTAFQNWE